MPKKEKKDRRTLDWERKMRQSSQGQHEHKNQGRPALSKGYITSSGSATPVVCFPIEYFCWQLTSLPVSNHYPTTQGNEDHDSNEVICR
jgi:hypothetical protein